MGSTPIPSDFFIILVNKTPTLDDTGTFSKHLGFGLGGLQILFYFFEEELQI